MPSFGPSFNLVPFGSGYEEELVSSLNQRPLRILTDGTPDVLYRSLSKDTLQVDMKTSVNGERATLKLEFFPITQPNVRFDLSSFEMKLENIRTGDVVWGITSRDNSAISFEGLKVGEYYTVSFPEAVGVLATPASPHAPHGPLRAREVPAGVLVTSFKG